MKKVLIILFSIVMMLSSSVAYGYSVDDAYYDFKNQHGDFVTSLTDFGVSEDTIISFLYDIYDYVLEIHSATGITPDNFESNALTAITRVSAREQYHSIQDALLVLYPDSIKMAVSSGNVSDEFKPIVETVKKIIFENGMLDFMYQDNTGDVESSSSPSVPSEGNNSVSTFTDINDSHWAYTAVKYLADNFILNGYLDGTFKPDANITRAEFAKIIVSATNNYDYSATSSFTDVSSQEWYYAYVSSAFKNGYITGYPDGSFHPDDTITRADICTIVYRCIKDSLANKSVPSQFFDDASIPQYAKDAVYALAGNNIINGIGNNSFSPASYATRAQTAKIVYQAIFAN